MRVSWDREPDLGYIRLAEGEVNVAASVSLGDLAAAQPGTKVGSLVLDFDGEGRLVGIEVFDARHALHPTLLDEAQSRGGERP